MTSAVQPSFFDDEDDEDEPLTAQERFERFHRRHPQVYTELRRLAFAWVNRGRSVWSIKGAWEVLRYERHIAGLPDSREEFKLNNNYHSRYARLLMDSEPALDGLFELRQLRS